MFLKFSVEILFKELSSKLKFHGNQHSNVHTSVKGVTNFYPKFKYFSTDVGLIMYQVFSHNTIVHLRVSWKVM